MIYPPEESHRRGIPVVVALEARIKRCDELIAAAIESGNLLQRRANEGRREAYRDALALVELREQITASTQRRQAGS